MTVSAREPIHETQLTCLFGSRILTVLASTLIALPACWGATEQDALYLHRYRLLVDAGVNEVTFWMTSQATGGCFLLGTSTSSSMNRTTRRSRRSFEQS